MSGGHPWVTQHPGLLQHRRQLFSRLISTVDQRDIATHHMLNGTGEQRVVRAPQHQGVDALGQERLEIGAGLRLDLVTFYGAGFDEFNELRTRRCDDAQVRGRGEGIFVGARPDRCTGADHADHPRARHRYRSTSSWLNHFNNGHLITLARIAQYCCGRRVAGDHDRLDTLGDQMVHDIEGKGPHLGERSWAVGPPQGVADIQNRFPRQTVKNRSHHRQTANATVENSDGGVGHNARAYGTKVPTPLRQVVPLGCSWHDELTTGADYQRLEKETLMSDWYSIRGDAAALPTDPLNMKFRPASVSLASLLVKVAAIWQFILGILVIWSAISTSQLERLFKGQELAKYSDGRLWFTGLIAIFFGLILWNVAKSLKEGDNTARIFVIALAVLNIVFGLLSHPWGIVAIVLNALVLYLLANSGSARWFADSTYEVKRPNAFS